MSAPDVGCNHINPTVPQFVADLASGLAVKAPIDPATFPAVDRRAVIRDPLIAFTRVRRP